MGGMPQKIEINKAGMTINLVIFLLYFFPIGLFFPFILTVIFKAVDLSDG